MDKRSIPARAGEASSTLAFSALASVHPRACGGNVNPLTRRRAAYGPSPRVRGKQLCRVDLAPHFRSIPARAGETILLAPFFMCACTSPAAPPGR